MDDAEKDILKGKFIRLVVLLNLDVLLFFLAAILYFLLLDKVQYGVALTVLFLVLALILGFLFVKRYRETKTWLDKHA
jgi:positive regulator of sigma E activity